MTLTRASVLHYWSARYGPLPIIGGAPVHTRNSSGLVGDARGEYYSAIINTPRFSWETDKSTTANERRAMLLLETGRTNTLQQSRNLAVSPWAGTATAAQNAAGLDGTLTGTTLTDSDAASIQYRQQTETVTNDNATHIKRYWVRKDTVTARLVGLECSLSGGTGVTAQVQLNTSTGVMTVMSGTGASVKDDGLHWLVELKVTNNTTGNVTLATTIYPAIGTVAGSNSAAATGSCVIEQVQTELATLVGSSPIITAAGSASRGPDSFYWQFPNVPQGMMIYLRFVERGGLALSARLLEISSSAGATPRFLVYGSSGLYTLTHDTGTPVSSAPATAPAIGDTVELVPVLTPLGAVQLYQSINGAAVTSGALSSALALAAAWADTKLWLNSEGATAVGLNAFADLRVVKYADVVGVTAQAIMDELRSMELGPNGDLL